MFKASFRILWINILVLWNTFNEENEVLQKMEKEMQKGFQCRKSFQGFLQLLTSTHSNFHLHLKKMALILCQYIVYTFISP